MHGGRMSEMERLNLMEQLRSEELCAKKVSMYQSQAQDPALQSILQQTTEMCQRHIRALQGMLQQETGMTM
ncbi:hypothetical protein [Desulfolucanica intricata]|uniref:hypothetical protein n=1 Tax=Desulfolucanica intricata TaxID=1285191 RepID=UPI00082E2CF8|nr:hypothetical protein [Desulfolucanica intricata]